LPVGIPDHVRPSAGLQPRGTGAQPTAVHAICPCDSDALPAMLGGLGLSDSGSYEAHRDYRPNRFSHGVSHCCGDMQ